MLRKLLTKKSFAEWLKAKHPNKIVGKTCTGLSCPVFNYLVENGINVTYVSGNKITYRNKHNKQSSSTTSDYFSKLIFRIDHSYEVRKKLTAKQVLHLVSGNKQ